MRPWQVRTAAGRALSGLWLWWRGRSLGFRQAVRTLALVVTTSLLSALIGLATASVSSPLGPHEATWSTTLDSRATLDLGPLGMASMDSPVSPLGVEVVLGEIPSAPDPAAADSASVGESLSSDVASYISVISHPELTIERVQHALIHDALRRAGVVEALILCAITAIRMAGSGRLRDALWLGARRGPAAVIASSVVVATVAALLVPALRSDPVRGTTLPALEGTPLAHARLSGRIADIATAYGPRVTTFLESNKTFYTTAETNLRVAWQRSEELGGAVHVKAVDGQVDNEALAEQAAIVSAAALSALVASSGPRSTPGEGASTATAATAVPTAPTASTASTASAASAASAGSTAAASASPSLTGAAAVASRAVTTAVLSTDLHCNLDVISLAGTLNELSGSDIHMDDGDLTMTGSNPEQVCVDALSNALPKGVDKVATIGNHDSDATAARLRSQGWTVTDGTVQAVGPLRILGDDDPDRTTATGSRSRNGESAAQVGQRLASTSCGSTRPDLVLIHQPATFEPLQSSGCAPLLLAGHVHAERGMTTVQGPNGPVSALISGAGKGGTSLGAVTEDAYLHVLSFDAGGALVAWRVIILHPDSSVTVGAWRPVPPAQPPAADASPSAGPSQSPTPISTGAQR